MVKLSAKVLDIDYRGVIINRSDARKIGVLDGDRIQIIYESTGVFVQAFVSTTEKLLGVGEVGIYHLTNKRLKGRRCF